MVLNCENIPDAEKQRVQAIQQQKDEAQEQKKQPKRSNSNTEGIGNDSIMVANSGIPPPPPPPQPGSTVDSHLNGTFGDMFNRLSNTHPGTADPTYFSYSTLAPGNGNGNNGQDVTSSLAGPSAVAGGSLGGPTGTPLDKQSGNYKPASSSASGNKKKRKKEDSTSGTAAGVGSNWNLSSFLGVS